MVIRWNFIYFDEQAFLNDPLKSDIRDTAKIPDVESAVDGFRRSFNSVVDKHTPFKNIEYRIGQVPGSQQKCPAERNKALSYYFYLIPKVYSNLSKFGNLDLCSLI